VNFETLFLPQPAIYQNRKVSPINRTVAVQIPNPLKTCAFLQISCRFMPTFAPPARLTSANDAKTCALASKFAEAFGHFAPGTP
jgi:hypothetical protein